MRLARSQHVSRGKCSTYRSWSRTNHNNPFIVSFYISQIEAPDPYIVTGPGSTAWSLCFMKWAPNPNPDWPNACSIANRHIRQSALSTDFLCQTTSSQLCQFHRLPFGLWQHVATLATGCQEIYTLFVLRVITAFSETGGCTADSWPSRDRRKEGTKQRDSS